MTMSFAKFIEAMDREQSRSSPLMDSGDENRSLRVVRSGNSFRNNDDGSFWEEFISLCGDAEGMAGLLGVRREQVANWPSRIRKAKDRVEMHDQMPEEKPEEDRKLMPTGDNGAITRDRMGPTGPIGGL